MPLLVNDVGPESPLNGHVVAGDFLHTLNAKRLTDAPTLRRILFKAKPDSLLEFTAERNSEVFTFQIPVPESRALDIGIYGIQESQAAAMRDQSRWKQERDQARHRFIETGLSEIRNTLNDGREPYLYRFFFLDSAFIVDGEVVGFGPDSLTIATWGWQGWEAVGTLSRTQGLALRNTQGFATSYGGGMGGLIDGVHVLFRRRISPSEFEHGDGRIRNLLAEIFDSS